MLVAVGGSGVGVGGGGVGVGGNGVGVGGGGVGVGGGGVGVGGNGVDVGGYRVLSTIEVMNVIKRYSGIGGGTSKSWMQENPQGQPRGMTKHP